MNDKIILLKDFIKKPTLYFENKSGIFVGKTKNSILIGPCVSDNFDFDFFYKRIISSCMYSKKMYKKIAEKTAQKYIENYKNDCDNKSSCIMEIYNNGEIVKHNLLFM